MRRVVVTGMGAVSPIGNNVPDMWANALAGKNGIAEITKTDVSDMKVKIAAEVKGFAPLEYITKEQVRKNDLYTQYAMAAAQQAVKDSGIEGALSPERLGVYIGSGIGGINTLLAEVDKMEKRGPDRVSPFLIPMMIANMAAGVVAIQHNAQGPCLPVVTACATSSNAIGEAYRCIQSGAADAIIAGGAEASINRIALAGFTNSMALTRRNATDCASIPFDARRDGFVMGEGAGVLVLEEMRHAIDRGANIYGEVVGYGNTCDAFHITAPHPESEGGSRAINIALEGLELADRNIYINAHGTSTPMNDKAETIAIKRALDGNLERVLVSSTKSMTGHMLGAAGAVEAIFALLALKNGEIPPTIGYEQPDPECDLDYVPNNSRKAELDVALSISLGFGGHNACLAFKKGGAE